MRTIIIQTNEAGQRLDKFLHKYMKEAPGSFFYKMMRKKNVVLNGQKCSGGEKLQVGDEIKLFFSEDTFEKFGASAAMQIDTTEYKRAFSKFGNLTILYENDHVLAVNKPSGVLSQKAQPSDLSLNEWLIGYLLHNSAVTAQDLATFKPAVCNRLDRNTSGLVLCGKSLEGLRFLTQQIRERSVSKFYRLFVNGVIEQDTILTGWLQKDEKKNQVHILSQPKEGASEIRTGIHPIVSGVLPGYGMVTYAEVELFTGKTHQIRAHLASLAHPLLGDLKYGDERLNAACRKYGVKAQLLHAYRVEFPVALSENSPVAAGAHILAPLPAVYDKILKEMQNVTKEY